MPNDEKDPDTMESLRRERDRAVEWALALSRKLNSEVGSDRGEREKALLEAASICTAYSSCELPHLAAYLADLFRGMAEMARKESFHAE